MSIVSDVKELVPQATSEGVDDGLISSFASTCIDTFSRIFPRDAISKTTVTSGNTSYTFSLPSDWEDRFSQVVEIEYPLGENPPEYVDEDSYTIYLDPDDSTKKLLFLDILPVEDFALSYTVRWTEDTLSDFDLRSVAILTAAMVCDRLAAKYAGHADNAFTADIMVWRTKSREYIDIKNNLLHLFSTRTGVDMKNLTPGAALSYSPSETSSGLFRDILEY